MLLSADMMVKGYIQRMYTMNCGLQLLTSVVYKIVYVSRSNNKTFKIVRMKRTNKRCGHFWPIHTENSNRWQLFPIRLHYVHPLIFFYFCLHNGFFNIECWSFLAKLRMLVWYSHKTFEPQHKMRSLLICAAFMKISQKVFDCLANNVIRDEC